MKLIQSFWSKPAFHTVQGYNNSRMIGGWANFRYFLVSTALSCLTIRKNHGEIDFFTDTVGNDLFIEAMNLPYDNVSLALDQLEHENHKLWVLGKMIAIRLQDKPFIHVDNDVFLWEKLPTSDASDFLIAQSRCRIWSDYTYSLEEIILNFSYVPDCLKEKVTASTMVTNIGIIGGNDVDFFQEFYETSRNLLEKNRDKLHLIDLGRFNQMMDEYLFTSMIKFQKRNIHYLLEASSQFGFPSSHLHLNLAPIVYKYIHLIGMNKRNLFSCQQLELRLEYEFPEYYSKIIEVINELQQSKESPLSGARHARVMRSVRILYTHTFDRIKKMKIRMAAGCEIISVSHDETAEIEFICREVDTVTGDVNSINLPFYSETEIERWRRFFKEPTSLNEIFEIIKTEHKVNQECELLRLHFEILDIVTSNITLLGIMEFI